MAQQQAINPAVLEADQERWLQEALNVVKQQSFAMKRNLDNKLLMEALKHASTMICELRTSTLNPGNYYSLYMEVMNELRHLESFFYEESRRGKRIAELYELVQHAGNVLPRLYLLVTVGSVFIKSQEAPASHVLKDLVEMLRGVQHPTRGLFLRSYLSQLCKDKLPDKGNQYEEAGGGSTKDSVDFVLLNFIEMNKLWVRIQHAAGRDQETREKERRQLGQLVSVNLVRLSQLDGVDVEMYKEHVLPRVLEQVLNCKDDLAQQYLLDCIIQVFPDEFHLHTLPMLLNTLPRLEPTVDIKPIITRFISRLIRFLTSSESEGAVPATLDVYATFEKYTAEAIENRKLPVADSIALYVSLQSLALNVNTEHSLENCNRIFGAVEQFLKNRNIDKITGRANIEQIVQLLTKPLEMHAPVAILSLAHYSPVMQYLEMETRIKVSKTIASAVIRRGKRLGDPDKVERLFTFLQPLMKDTPGDNRDVDEDEFAEEQSLIARLAHLVDHEDTDIAFQMYDNLRQQFKQGGEKRARYTLVPLMFSALKLAQRLYAREQDAEQAGKFQISCKKVFQLIHDIGTTIAPLSPTLALPLFLQAATVAGEANYESIAYEFFTQAFNVYETEYAATAKLQAEAVALISGCLYALRGLTSDNYDTLVLKTVQHSAKLLKKEDQCRAVCQASHLFWHDEESGMLRDNKRVVECLQKALKTADSLMDGRVKTQLFIEIFDHYLYYFTHDAMTPKMINQLLALIKTNMTADLSEAAQTHYKNTLMYVKQQQQSDARFNDIELQ